MRVKIVILFCLLVLNFSLRFLLPFNLNIEKPPLLGPDSHYHTRRVLLGVKKFPNIPGYDSYLSYPTGGYCIWPPGYDLLCTIIAYPVFWITSSEKGVEWVCAIYSILWSCLLLCVTYLVGKCLFNEIVGLLATFFVAILPCSLWWSTLGYNDHHIVESITLILLTYLFIGKRNKKMGHWIILGIIMGAGMLFWQGTILFAGLIFLILLIFREFMGVISFSIATLIILPFSINTHFVDSPFSYRGLSLLHLSLLVIAVLAMTTLLFLKKKHRILFFTAGFILIFLLFFLFRTKSFLGGISFILKKDPWLSSILEFKPLMIHPEFIETVTLKSLYGNGYYVWPLILFILLWENRKERGYYIFSIFVIFAGVMSFIARRYAVWFAPYYSIILGFIIYKVHIFLTKVTKNVFLRTAVCSIIVAIIIEPAINYGYKKEHWIAHSEQELAAYQWINDSTPKTSYYFEPHKKPEYGIMCSWNDGHNIVYHARRPVSASNFGNDMPNFYYNNSFFLAESESLANEILDKLNCRYIYLACWQYELKDAIIYSSKSLDEYFDFFFIKDKAGMTRRMMVPKEKGYSVAISRLYRFLGSGAYMEGVYFPPYRHYRLRYVSDDGSIKIFEYVKGAVIKGSSKPRSSFRLTLPVKIGQFSFVYYDSLTADEKGEFATTVPYGTDSLKPYIIEITGIKSKAIIGNDSLSPDSIRNFPRVSPFALNEKNMWRKKIFITEEDVRKGEVIYVE